MSQERVFTVLRQTDGKWVYASGPDFPDTSVYTPPIGALFTRTDLLLTYQWDGTQWVSTAPAGSTITIEEFDGVPSVTADTLVFGSEFTVTDLGGGDSQVDLTNPLTVEEVDGNPSVQPVTTLKFAQADGFAVTDEGGGIARVNVTSTPAPDFNAQTIALLALMEF